MMPPPVARWLLGKALPDEHRAVVLAHLDEEFARARRERSAGAAAWWYRRQAFGSLPGALQMRARSLGLFRLPGELTQDARYALRQMRRAPGFSATAVLMLAIGLGLVAGAYTVVNGIFVRGWAVPDSASVFRAGGSVAGAPEGGRIRDGFSLGAFKHFRENARSADYVAYLIQYFSLYPTPDAPRVHSAGLFVSDNFLTVLKIPLQLGPGFGGTAASDGARMIITDRVWRKRFDADAGVVGRSVRLTGVPVTIVGVTAPGFDSLAERPVELLVEISSAPRWKQGVAEAVADERSCCIILAGRRRAGWTTTQVREELALLTAQYRRSTAQPELTIAMGDTAPGVPPGRGAGPVFGLLGAAVTLVWCLTCANVGNLFLARSLRRDREIAVRLALGASRARLVRQLLAEGLVLAAFAGSAAVACTAGVPFLMARIDGTAAMFAPDLVVAAVAALGTIATCLLVSLAPALQATRIAWKGAGTTTTARGRGLREIALAVQIAVAAVLVLSATLIGRGIGQASDARADFALKTTTAASFWLPPETVADQSRRDALRAALRDAASRSERRLALVDQSPAARNAGIPTSVQRATASRTEFSAKLLPMSAAAFHILEVPVVQGRLHHDSPAAAEAVINQTLARRMWPGESAIGKTLVLHYNSRIYTIVGVTRDAHLTVLGAIEPLVHIPPSGPARDGSRTFLLARSTPDLGDRLTALAKGIDPALMVTLTPLTESVQSTLNDARAGAAIAAGLGGVALLLAIAGVFGVFSYLIEERRREIGIRLALGATKRQIRVALFHACRRPVLMGMIGGLVLSLLAGGLLRRLLFGLSPVDPASYAIVGTVLLLAAIAATAVPVRRALRVDPAIALRAE